MASKWDLALVDYSGEHTRSQWYMSDITAANLVAVTADADVIRLAIDAITLCNEGNMTTNLIGHAANGVAPTDPNAQRELAIRIFYTDTVNGRKGYVTIPGPDLTALTLAKDEVALADGGVMAALVTALQNRALSRDGNAITITSARVVGRNN